METTVGQLLINDALPEDMRDHTRVLDKKGMKRLFEELARKHPDKYRQVSKDLSDIGWRAAQETGGYSFSLAHMSKAKAAKQIRDRLRTKLNEILADDKLDDKQRAALIVRHIGQASKDQQEQVYEESLAEGNPLAFQVQSGSRGNKMNLSSLRGSDMLYADHRDEPIPVPVLRSYAEGLTPAEYWAGTYGARKGVMATKFATQDAGFLSKQLNQISHRLVVVDADGDGVPDGIRGLPVNVDDEDNEGALLATDAGPYKRNTVLTPKIQHDLKRRGLDRILVRSPMVGGASNGGIYANDVGVRETGRLPTRGEVVGLAAAQALSEPLSQAQLSAKHSGGVAGEEKAVSGFDYINQLIQVPKTFRGGAAHSQQDGIVTRVEPAPAGGHYVYVNGEKHYVAEGYDLKVKRGDRVESGDVLSEGIPNPSEIVRHKGVGEGRRYFVDAFKTAMQDAGLNAHRRNIELLARGLINHVRLTDEWGDYVPDDVVPYSAIEAAYQPRPDARKAGLKAAVGKYLERPVMHYTVGTRVQPSMLTDLEKFGVNELDVHDEPPPFEPEMIRGMNNLQHDPDWMTRMYGSGLKKSLLGGAARGATSNEQGTSFVPAISRGVDFGRTGLIKTPEPATGLSKVGSSLFPGGDAPGSNQGTGLKPPKPPAAPTNPTAGMSLSQANAHWAKELGPIKRGPTGLPLPDPARRQKYLELRQQHGMSTAGRAAEHAGMTPAIEAQQKARFNRTAAQAAMMGNETLAQHYQRLAEGGGFDQVQNMQKYYERRSLPMKLMYQAREGLTGVPRGAGRLMGFDQGGADTAIAAMNAADKGTAENAVASAAPWLDPWGWGFSLAAPWVGTGGSMIAGSQSDNLSEADAIRLGLTPSQGFERAMAAEQNAAATPAYAAATPGPGGLQAPHGYSPYSLPGVHSPMFPLMLQLAQRFGGNLGGAMAVLGGLDPTALSALTAGPKSGYRKG